MSGPAEGRKLAVSSDAFIPVFTDQSEEQLILGIWAYRIACCSVATAPSVVCVTAEKHTPRAREAFLISLEPAEYITRSLD